MHFFRDESNESGADDALKNSRKGNRIVNDNDDELNGDDYFGYTADESCNNPFGNGDVGSNNENQSLSSGISNNDEGDKAERKARRKRQKLEEELANLA